MSHPKPRASISLSDIAAAVTILSAFAFFVSAVIQALIIYRYFKVNFFALASPADVVMGGFIVFAFSGFITFLLWGVLLAVSLIEAKFGIAHDVLQSPYARAKKAFQLGVVAVIVASFALAVSAARGDVVPFVGTGLHTGRSPELPMPCREKTVAWLGSDFAIVACDDRFLVSKDMDALGMTTDYFPAD